MNGLVYFDKSILPPKKYLNFYPFRLIGFFIWVSNVFFFTVSGSFVIVL